MFLARNKNNRLTLFDTKPVRCEENGFWYAETRDDNEMDIDSRLFPELSWKDEPIEIELKIKEK